MGDSRWTALPAGVVRRADLAALAAFPVVFALLVLDASPGRLLAFLPRYRYEPTPGDAYGFYYCAREILATARRDAPFLALALVGTSALVVIVRRRTADRATRIVAVSWAIGIVAAFLAAGVRFTGAAQMGWPLLWSVPLAPLDVLGRNDPKAAFVVGLAISLACNALTVVATYAMARRAGLGATVGLAGAGLVSLWPLLSLLTGPHAARNGAWQEWLGLSLYTEPVSTALVATALALLVAHDVPAEAAASAGALFGFATFVRNTDVLIFGVALCVLAWRRRWRPAAALVSAAAAWAPASLLFWPKGYPHLEAPVFPKHPFELEYARRAWSDSYLWHPSVLVVLVPLAVLGLAAVRRPAAVVLGGATAATALFYSFYANTPAHPRFLYVVVPVVLLLWAAGAEIIIGRVAAR
jgi:hypothetical protein